MEFFGSWSILTTNFLIVLYVAIGGVTLSSILVLVNAQWRYQVYGYAAAFNALLPVAFIMLLILLFNGESTFPWLADAENQHLSGWHNYTFLVAREIIGFLIVAFCCWHFCKMQKKVASNESSEKDKADLKFIAVIIPFVYVFYGTMVAWDFEMTMLPGWHSAIYGVYHFVSNFHGFLACFALFLIYLDLSGKRKKPYDARVLNFMAQLMLGFTILWTYFYFSQYLLIWYGRLPEEIVRFNSMDDGLGLLWTGFLLLKFVIPFISLATIKAARHNPILIGAVACSILAGTWLERYVWISGSVDSRYYHMPFTHWFDIVVTAGIVVICSVVMHIGLRNRAMIK